MEEVLPPNSPDCNPFDYFVWGVSGLRVYAKSQNKFMDLKKKKEVMGSFSRDTLAKDCPTCFRSRIEAVFTDKLIHNMYLCNFYFISIKSDDSQLCCAI